MTSNPDESMKHLLQQHMFAMDDDQHKPPAHKAPGAPCSYKQQRHLTAPSFETFQHPDRALLAPGPPGQAQCPPCSCLATCGCCRVPTLHLKAPAPSVKSLCPTMATEVTHLMPPGCLTYEQYKQPQFLLQASSLLPAGTQRPGGVRSGSFRSAASSAGGSFRGVMFSFEDGTSSFGQGMFHSPQRLCAPAEPHRGDLPDAVAWGLNLSRQLLHSWCTTALESPAARRSALGILPQRRQLRQGAPSVGSCSALRTAPAALNRACSTPHSVCAHPLSLTKVTSRMLWPGG